MKSAIVAPRNRVRLDPMERREQILAVAVQLIGEKGFKDVTIKEIADRCNLTRPGLLHHFPTKEDLLVEVLENIEKGALREMVISAPPQLDARGKVEYSLREVVAKRCRSSDVTKLFLVLRVEALDINHPAHTYLQDREKRMTDMLADAIDSFRPDGQVIARRLYAAMMGLEYRWLCEDRSFDLVKDWEQCMKAILAA